MARQLLVNGLIISSLLIWISILAIPVGTVIPQAPVRVGRMCSWPMLQAPDTVRGGHMAATRA